MAGRFPGAPDVGALWRNLRGGVDSLRRFSRAELAAKGVPATVLDTPGYVKAGQVVDGARWTPPAPPRLPLSAAALSFRPRAPVVCFVSFPER